MWYNEIRRVRKMIKNDGKSPKPQAGRQRTNLLGRIMPNPSCATCAYFVPDKKKPERGLCFGNKARAKGSCSQWKAKKCTVIPK